MRGKSVNNLLAVANKRVRENSQPILAQPGFGGAKIALLAVQ